jgi:hypothetical protein
VGATASGPGALSGWERCGIDRGRDGSWGGRALLAGEVNTLETELETPEMVGDNTYRDDGSKSTCLIESSMSVYFCH